MSDTIYLLYFTDWQGSCGFDSAWSTREKAEAYILTCHESEKYSIEECPIDKPLKFVDATPAGRKVQ